MFSEASKVQIGAKTAPIIVKAIHEIDPSPRAIYKLRIIFPTGSETFAYTGLQEENRTLEQKRQALAKFGKLREPIAHDILSGLDRLQQQTNSRLPFRDL